MHAKISAVDRIETRGPRQKEPPESSYQPRGRILVGHAQVVRMVDQILQSRLRSRCLFGEPSAVVAAQVPERAANPRDVTLKRKSKIGTGDAGRPVTGSAVVIEAAASASAVDCG